jgi:alkaline phosphatase
MKFRNQLIAAACLLVFVGLGGLYIRMWVVQKPRQIILFVSDALATRPLTAARLYAGGADYRLELEKFPHTALLRNASEEFAVPDTASASTAIATGHRTRHHAVAATGKGRAFDTILEKARSEGRAIGLVTNSILTAPSTAAFYAHTARPEESDGIALQLFEREWMKVVLGGGRADFQPEGEGGRRKDGRDLVAEWQAKGVQVVRSKADLETAEGGDAGRVVGLFSGGPLAFANQMESGSEQPSLADMTRRAIDLLKSQRRGYVLVVDAALFTSACEANQAERALREVMALDEAVSVAVREAGDKALVVAVGRHGTGGLTLSGYPLLKQQKGEFFGPDPSGYPYLSWASGPNGPQPGITVPRSEPAAVAYPAGLNTAEDMIAVGRGPGAERLSGFMDNTVIFSILKEAL